MSSILDSRYTINGVINTDRSALENLSTLCSACGTWLTYDTHEGKFAVVINKSGSPTWAFTDDNIIGPIKIALTPLDKIYNTVKVVYPHEDLKGKTDFIQISIPQGERLANEFENVLNLNYQVVTNPVQAQLLGFIELKQSRVDKVITFTTDFSNMGVKAGDLISVTNNTLGFSAKVFRVISVSESDLDDGNIEINITALEYDESVYDTSNLSRYIRTDSDGIIPIGSLPAPAKPTIVKTELAAQPSLNITTSISAGLVDNLEFWSSPDVAMQEADRLYTILRTQPSGAESFPLNTPITINVETASASDFVVKCRSTNKEGVSEFSLPSDTVNYAPQLVSASMNVTDPLDNNNLMSPAVLALLLRLVRGMFGNSSNIFDASLSMQSVGTGTWQFNAIDLTGDGSYHTINLVSFAAPCSCRYKATLYINWGGAGAPGVNGVLKNSEVGVAGKTLGNWASTGDEHVQLYEDHQVQGFFTAVEGEMINLQFNYATDWPTATVWIIAEVAIVSNFNN